MGDRPEDEERQEEEERTWQKSFLQQRIIRGKAENTGIYATQRETFKRKLLNKSKSSLLNKCKGKNN